ncbi:hypothetical protein K9M06_01040 [Candidatus Bipolaricaulota bacterium]|nr:hypothetical protein [Candidatus Bipolaricaulota bacterium]
MFELIKKLLGSKRLEEDRRELEESLVSLTELLKQVGKIQTDLVQRVEELEEDQSELSTNYINLERGLKEVREDLEDKVGRAELQYEFHQLEEEMGRINDLVQEAKRDRQDKGSLETTDPAGSEEATIQEKIGNLPSSLKGVVRVLFDNDTALNYQELADEMNKREATARSYVYRLKERSFPLEFVEEDGEKKRVKLPLEVTRRLAIPE